MNVFLVMGIGVVVILLFLVGIVLGLACWLATKFTETESEIKSVSDAVEGVANAITGVEGKIENLAECVSGMNRSLTEVCNEIHQKFHPLSNSASQVSKAAKKTISIAENFPSFSEQQETEQPTL